MTECSIIDGYFSKSMCRACLKITEEVFPMSTEEIIVYRNFADKMTMNEFNMVLCLICKWMLKKCMKFITQVQRASRILNEVSEKDLKSFLEIQLNNYDIRTTEPATVDIDPEVDISSEMDIPNEIEEFIADDNQEDDDEIPLVMLQDFKSKKRKNSEELNIEETDIKQEAEIKIESDSQEEKFCSKRVRKKKEIREGFTSRMRQETDEYVVIKLTADQVRQELMEKAKTESYLRAPFKCDNCVKGFNFEDVLLTHMEKHRLDHGSLQCNICTQYCPSAVSLRGHLKSHTTRYKCKLCGQVRLSRQHLLEHYTISHTSAPITYTCDKCDFTTNKRTVVQRHVRSQHGAGERHACHTCGKLFNTIESLRVHTMRHDKSKRLHCDRCDKYFIYPSLLHKHVQAVHEKREYYCVECDIKFKSPESMRLHFKKAKRHRDDSSYKYECPHCSERFVSTSTLSVHLSTSHGEAKQHACDICNNHYSSKESLRGHIWRVHNQKKEAPANCHLCAKSFTRKSILKVHVRSHTGERPYICSCGAAFTQKASLKVHAARHSQKDHQPRIEVQNLPQES